MQCRFDCRWHGLAALAYENKMYENLFCGVFGEIYENLHQQKFPVMRLVVLHFAVQFLWTHYICV